ncbi:MAG: guanylate kinase [Lachnospiraceae bacterium]|nr:guanylate kinase [Lachnospiraceae bacterium]MBO7532085.1 guanylate kinase [Lachnospiraceae bacterium]MBP5253599.1 guanylate kinase [Lachnospiraceae bacterium]MBP5472779.1 guanylate kinase [Lachnospiraceae bacterium]MBP5700980.1 guanylate kinase [Lachnospiraceae bacterium]
MAKIICLLGKSCSGKDTIYKKLLADESLNLLPLVTYTTRPMRTGEQEGREYHFTDEAGFNALKDAGKVIEDRTYDTVYGLWRYFTVDDGTFDKNGRNVIAAAGTIPAYIKLRDYFGAENTCPIMIETDDGIRLERAMRREKKQEAPRYKEMCRRFITDSEDFDEEKMKAAGVDHVFMNNEDLDKCIREVSDFIRSL